MENSGAVRDADYTPSCEDNGRGGPAPVGKTARYTVGHGDQKKSAPAKILDTSVSRALLPRALRIWQALLVAFERRGYVVTCNGPGDTVVSVLGESFGIALHERRKQVFVQRTWGRSMEYVPSGLLFLRVGRNYSGSGTADKPPHLIEDRLNRFIAGLVRRAINAKAARAIREDREERWRIKDDERRQQQRERLSDAVRVRHLRKLAAQWARDRRLVEFLTDVK